HRVGNRRDRGPAHDSAREDDLEAGSSRMTARDYPRIVVPPPGPKARAIVERQDRFASTSYPKEYPLAVARGERAMVEDVYGNRYRCEYCRAESECTRRCTSWIEDELFAKKIPPDSVAAIFVEPIQGEGGYVVPPAGYLRDLRELCDRYGILLVCDEVQSGV